MKRLAPLVLMLLTACSAAPAVTVTASPTPGYVCEDASDLGDSILEDTEYISLQAWAVRDPAHAKAYYVAIKLAGDEVDGKVALWATNSLTLPASIRSVDMHRLTEDDGRSGIPLERRPPSTPGSVGATPTHHRPRGLRMPRRVPDPRRAVHGDHHG